MHNNGFPKTNDIDPQLVKSINMIHLNSLPKQFFDKVILSHPGLVILCLLAVVSFLGYQTKNFKLDASAETLVLENDRDLEYSRIINTRYGEQDYLFLAYAPKDDLFSDKVIANLTTLRNELKNLEYVSSVVSILDTPLLESPPVPIKKLATNIRTLESPEVDKKLARTEFKESPLYRDLIISKDLKFTAIQIVFPVNEKYFELLSNRNLLREKQKVETLTKPEAAELKKVMADFKQHRDQMRKTRHQNISEIRAIMKKYSQDADLHLGGINMIADDMISFIKKDLKVFGTGVLLFMVIMLRIIFKKTRWIFLPMLCCFFSAISMAGLLGLFGWEVTVISSNFISLQLIITMAITIHLTVRYLEHLQNHPDADQKKLILDSVCLMLKPCLYAALTTIAGFASLVLCDIRPVITFGWMMIGGITISLVMTFLLFPSVLMLMTKKPIGTKKNVRFSFTSVLAGFTEYHGTMILVASCIIIIISIIGISRLVVENSFIDYFKDTTEIYRGMKIIDQNLGGTTPIDIIIELDEPNAPVPPAVKAENEDTDADFDEFDEFEAAEDNDKYWFTSDKMARIVKIHDYLDSLPETGKVLSLATMMKIAYKLNNGKPLDNFQLALLYSEIPDKFKNIILKPYVSVEHDQVRFSVRVKDSEKTLKRNELIKRIKQEMTGRLGIAPDHLHLTGMLVLYNNMLQSLFRSQILTLSTVVLALICMFLILFRSLKIALIAIYPNLLSISVVLGVMGWLNIPLDMMTITIAAISVGIAVDNTIHYIHRLRQEFSVDRNYIKAVYRCHGSIGNALYYTSITIILGFSILALSNFIPSVYFGLLTGLAMLIALLGALTLLPQLFIFFKPLGPESSKD